MTRHDYSGELTDSALRDEIELVGDLVDAALASEGPLPLSEIDRVLGVSPSHTTPRPTSEAHAHDALPRRRRSVRT